MLHAGIGVQSRIDLSQSYAQRARRWPSELFHHVIAREARRLAVDRRCDTVALFQVKAGSLDAEGRQRDPSAAAPSALFFRHCQHPATNPSAPPILGQEEPGNVYEPEFGSSVEPADNPSGLRVADEYGERAKIVVSGLADIVSAEASADYR